VVVVAIVTAIVLAQPAPERAAANPVCDTAGGAADAVSGGVGAITGGAIGGGNPVGDACNKVTDKAIGALTDPLGGAVAGIGNSVFAEITQWVSEGAAWLIEKVAAGVERTTTPKLTTRGFLDTYSKMALIGALMASAMLLAAVLEGLAQGNMAMLGRVVLVNLPLALIATSVAYLIVQMLLVGTDGLCHAIGEASGRSGERFFAAAVHGLGDAGGNAGEAVGAAQPGGRAGGEVAVPLFVTFLAAIVGALAAFCVWLELLMRDAAVYVVALFAPLALAASIWPRWSGALRRSGELLAVVIGSKFVIVSIIALAAGLVSEDAGGVEHLLAAAALMVLACFAPFALFRLVPFAEGAMAAAYGRRHAAGGASGAVRSVSSTAQTVQRAARASWERGSGGAGSGLGSGVATGAAGARPRGPGASAGASRGGAGAAAAGTAGIALAGSLPLAAASGAQAAAGHLAQSGVTRAAQSNPSAGSQTPPATPGTAAAKPAASVPRPSTAGGGDEKPEDRKGTGRETRPPRGPGERVDPSPATAPHAPAHEGPPRPAPEPPSHPPGEDQG
jgi:hypothetical protein